MTMNQDAEDNLNDLRATAQNLLLEAVRELKAIDRPVRGG